MKRDSGAFVAWVRQQLAKQTARAAADTSLALQGAARKPTVFGIDPKALARIELRDDDYIIAANGYTFDEAGNVVPIGRYEQPGKFGSRVDQGPNCPDCGFRVEKRGQLCDPCANRRAEQKLREAYAKPLRPLLPEPAPAPKPVIQQPTGKRRLALTDD